MENVFNQMQYIDKILHCVRKQIVEYSKIGESNFWTNDEFKFKNENYEILNKVSQNLWDYLYLQSNINKNKVI